MQNFIIIMKLLPAIIAAIKAIEEAIPGQGAGEMKLAALREMLEALDGGVTTLWPEISKVVTIFVALFNKNGWTKSE